jgi:hypothetical protein
LEVKAFHVEEALWRGQTHRPYQVHSTGNGFEGPGKVSHPGTQRLSQGILLKLLNNQLGCKRDKDLAKISDLLVILQRRLSEANLSITQVIRKRESYKKLHKTSESEATRLRSKVDGQAKQKRVHSKEMSLLAVQKQQLALETQCKEKQQATKEKLQDAQKEKKSLIKYTTQIRGEEKAKDLAAKDQILKEKLDKATSCLSMAASVMNHQNYALLGGTFSPPTPTQSHVVTDNSIGSVSNPA